MLGGVIENRITGFEFHPAFEKIKGEEVLKSLKVEFLEKGWVISETTIDTISEEELDRLQEQLLYSVIMNLGIAKNRIEAEKLAKIAKRLEVVNMFKIQMPKNGATEIDFIKSGYFAASSQIRNVPHSKFQLLEDILSDHTENNLKCTRQCEAVTYLDSLAVIEQKINR